MALRACDTCGGVDETARHTIVHAPGAAPAVDPEIAARVADNPELSGAAKVAALADLADTSLQSHHLDHCADLGCPEGA